MALINIHDEEEMFGLREVEYIGSPHNSASGAEDDYDDDIPEGESQTAQPQQPSNEANDAPDSSAAKIIKPKRVIKNPQPKFDAARLCGPRGIGVVQKFLSEAPYRGKGYETEDLGLLLQKLKHWAHRLYPKLPFLDSIAQIEKLGNKKAVQVNVKRLRLDMYDTPKENDEQGVVEEDDVMRMGDAAPAAADADEPDVFDELLRHSGATQSLEERIAESTPASQPSVLSAEQKERIERSRQLALQRQRAKITAAAPNLPGVDASSSSAPLNGNQDGSAAGQAPSGAMGSRKRNLDENEVSQDESVQPTQEEVRKLREKLLGSVKSQEVTSNSVENNEDHQASYAFDDEYGAMDIDEVMDSLKDVENLEGGISGDPNVGCQPAVGNDPSVVTGGGDIVDTNLNSSQFESNKVLSGGSEASLIVVDQVDKDSSSQSSNDHQVIFDPQSSLKNQSCDNLTSSHLGSTVEASASSQFSENSNMTSGSGVSTEPVLVAEDTTDSTKMLPRSSALADVKSADLEILGEDAVPDVIAHTDKIEDFALEDCNVSR